MPIKLRPGKPPALKRWQVSYIKRAARIRKTLTNGALAKKFGIGESTVQGYICNHGVHGCREDYEGTVQKFRAMRAELRGEAPE